MKIIADIFEYTSKKCLSLIVFLFLDIICKKLVLHDIEMGYTFLADGFLEYIRTGIKAGIDIDAFAPRLSFSGVLG